MTVEANQLLAAALKKVDLRDGFSPRELGAKIGLTPAQAEAAARSLANAGVLVLGFDSSAEFSVDFRKSRTAAPSGAGAAGTSSAKSAKKARMAAVAAEVSASARRERGRDRERNRADARLTFTADSGSGSGKTRRRRPSAARLATAKSSRM